MCQLVMPFKLFNFQLFALLRGCTFKFRGCFSTWSVESCQELSVDKLKSWKLKHCTVEKLEVENEKWKSEIFSCGYTTSKAGFTSRTPKEQPSAGRFGAILSQNVSRERKIFGEANLFSSFSSRSLFRTLSPQGPVILGPFFGKIKTAPNRHFSKWKRWRRPAGLKIILTCKLLTATFGCN